MLQVQALSELKQKFFSSNVDDYVATWEELEKFGCTQHEGVIQIPYVRETFKCIKEANQYLKLNINQMLQQLNSFHNETNLIKCNMIDCNGMDTNTTKHSCQNPSCTNQVHHLCCIQLGIPDGNYFCSVSCSKGNALPRKQKQINALSNPINIQLLVKNG